MLIWKIAWRNVLRHKGKSMVVGAILFLGMLLMTVGNASINGAAQGILSNIVNSFSGDIVLVSEQQKINDLFFAQHPVKVIHNYLDVKAVLDQQEILERYLPIARGQVKILNPNGVSTDAFVFGVNFDDYRGFFDDNVELREGEWLANDGCGILLSDKLRETLFKRQGLWTLPHGESPSADSLTPKAWERLENGRLDAQHDLVLLGQSGETLQTDIRLPVNGIFRFKQLNTVWGEMYSFIDIESFRQAFGHVMASQKIEDLSAEARDILINEVDDDIFSAIEFVQEVEGLPENLTTDALENQPQRQDVSSTVNRDDGAYNMIMLKLKPGVSPSAAEQQLQDLFERSGLGLKVLTWKVMLAEVADIAVIIQSALFLFILSVFFVAIIIIMNTLSMAALERSGEIAMMRAVGAQRGLIGKMFLAETMQIAAGFGGAGIALGVLLVWGIAALNLSAGENEMLSLLMGGRYLHSDR